MSNHHELLVVFFAKNGGARLGAGQQLQDDGADTREEARPKLPFQHIGQFGGRHHLKALGLRVQRRLGGRKQQVAAGGLELGAVGGKGARVGVKVFAGAKLQAVHKNGGHLHVTQGLGNAHQV